LKHKEDMLTRRDLFAAVTGAVIVAIVNISYGGDRNIEISTGQEESHVRHGGRKLLLDPKSVEEKVSRDLSIFSSTPKSYNQWLSSYNGWNNIWVYTGTDTGSVIPLGRTTESQSGQDETIARIFPNGGGYFIDMAANAPVYISNTKYLEQNHNWNGLCVEPNSFHWYGLANRRCKVVAAFIADEEDSKIEVVFERPGVQDDSGGTTVGGIVNNDIQDNVNAPVEMRKTRYSTTFPSVLKKFDVPKTIDYFSLDVEGAEYIVMSKFPFDQYRINVMTVERPTPALVQLLLDNEYLYVGDHGIYRDEMWVHESFSEQVDKIFPRDEMPTFPGDYLWRTGRHAEEIQ